MIARSIRCLGYSCFFAGVLVSSLLAAEPEGKRGARIEAISKTLAGGDEELTYHALVIGINAYREEAGWTPLAFPESDANRLVKLLKESYAFTDVQYLSGKDATREAILRALEGYKKSLGADDALLIFYAGHGYTISEGAGRDGYWIPADGTREYSSWVGMDALHALMNESLARHVLLVSDSCYAGAFFSRGFKIDDSVSRVKNTIYEKQIRKRSRFVITSGNMEEVPDKSFFAESMIGLLEEEFPPYVFSAEDLYFELKRPVFRQTGTEVLGREMVEDGAGGNFVFIQRAPVEQEAMLILQVSPPLAEVEVEGVIDHVRERVLNEDEQKVGEHRIRVKPNVSKQLLITAPGFHDKLIEFNGAARQRKSQAVALRPWVPRDFVEAAEGGAGSYVPHEIDNALSAKVYQDASTWNKGETTVTRISPSKRYFAVGSYMRSTNLQRGSRSGRFGRTYAGVVLLCDTQAESQQDLYCYPPQPKEKDERSCRRVRDVLFLPRNERYVVALTGDHLFLWDVEQAALRKKLKLPRSLRTEEKGSLAYIEKSGKSYIQIAAEKTANPSYELLTE